MKLFGNRLNRRILAALAHGERNVTDLAQVLGQSMPSVSTALGKLQQYSIVLLRVDGRNRFYRLGPRIQASFPDSSVCFALTAQDRSSAQIVTPIT